MPALIDLYSDTQTLPTPEMFEAARRAPLGDDIIGTDPTVNRLQEMAAERLGKEAALFMPSGTMANLVGIMLHGGHGDEIFLAADCHMLYYESGALASVAGYMPCVLPARPGLMDAEELAEAIRRPNPHFPRPRTVVLENTHNLGGGTVLPPERWAALCEAAHRHGLAVHLDGARIFNAAVALDMDVKDLVRGADTVMFCLSKGLSCPAGSLLLGPRALMERARALRKRLGGAMRQAGVLAAMGIVALESLVDRLAEDHANARRLAEGLARIEGLDVEMETVQTNMVFCILSGIERDAFLKELERSGVRASASGAHHVRFVTHRGISTGDVDAAVSAVAGVMERVHRTPTQGTP